MNTNNNSSILRRLMLAYLGFGLAVAMVFPFYAAYFVEWKPGMLPWFVAGCVVAGLSIGVANYYLLNLILLSKLRRIAEDRPRDLSRYLDAARLDRFGAAFAQEIAEG